MHTLLGARKGQGQGIKLPPLYHFLSIPLRQGLYLNLGLAFFPPQARRQQSSSGPSVSTPLKAKFTSRHGTPGMCGCWDLSSTAIIAQ